ncbi:helix-turn-helix domain-containing protein [Enterovirga sp. CN4-39]|uniref:helix-turn-helix domain-containing protein n=1 Tax=Enterovirga sp. CN4-39 TaxID=3400910 RepID=UPI003C06FC07
MTDKTCSRLLLQKEVAERLGCSETTVARLRFEGKLAYIPGRPVLINEADLQAYLDANAEAKRLKREQAEAETARLRAFLKSPAFMAMRIHRALSRMKERKTRKAPS